MTRRQNVAVLAAVGALGAGSIGIGRLTGNDQPQGIKQPVVLLAAAGPNGPTGPAGCAVTFTVPGKQWNGVFHYSPTILKPTRLEKVCVTYPAAGGTLASVSVVPA